MLENIARKKPTIYSSCQKTMCNPCIQSNQPFFVQLVLIDLMSIGVAVYPTYGYDFDVLKVKDDEAMVQEKLAGKN